MPSEPKRDPIDSDSATPASTASAERRRTAEHWVVLTLAAVALVGMLAMAFFLEPDERGFESVGDAPATIDRSGLKAFWTSLRLLGTCFLEAPELACDAKGVVPGCPACHAP